MMKLAFVQVASSVVSLTSGFSFHGGKKPLSPSISPKEKERYRKQAQTSNSSTSALEFAQILFNPYKQEVIIKLS